MGPCYPRHPRLENNETPPLSHLKHTTPKYWHNNVNAATAGEDKLQIVTALKRLTYDDDEHRLLEVQLLWNSVIGAAVEVEVAAEAEVSERCYHLHHHSRIWLPEHPGILPKANKKCLWMSLKWMLLCHPWLPCLFIRLIVRDSPQKQSTQIVQWISHYRNYQQ